jgi:hypothetical protein
LRARRTWCVDSKAQAGTQALLFKVRLLCRGSRFGVDSCSVALLPYACRPVVWRLNWLSEAPFKCSRAILKPARPIYHQFISAIVAIALLRFASQGRLRRAESAEL